MPIEDKSSLPFIQLCDKTPDDIQLPNEKLSKAFESIIPKMPFLYEDTQFLTMKALNENGREAITRALKEILEACGFDLFTKFMFEVKFDKAEG